MSNLWAGDNSSTAIVQTQDSFVWSMLDGSTSPSPRG